MKQFFNRLWVICNKKWTPYLLCFLTVIVLVSYIAINLQHSSSLFNFSAILLRSALVVWSAIYAYYVVWRFFFPYYAIHKKVRIFAQSTTQFKKSVYWFRLRMPLLLVLVFSAVISCCIWIGTTTIIEEIQLFFILFVLTILLSCVPSFMLKMNFYRWVWMNVPSKFKWKASKKSKSSDFRDGIKNDLDSFKNELFPKIEEFDRNNKELSKTTDVVVKNNRVTAKNNKTAAKTNKEIKRIIVNNSHPLQHKESSEKLYFNNDTADLIYKLCNGQIFVESDFDTFRDALNCKPKCFFRVKKRNKMRFFSLLHLLETDVVKSEKWVGMILEKMIPPLKDYDKNKKKYLGDDILSNPNLSLSDKISHILTTKASTYLP